MSESFRIMIADDHELVRRGLRTILQSQPEWAVCGEAANGREAVERAIDLRPHVVVMDLTMPELNGLEATRRIRRALPETEVLILSLHYSEALVQEVLAAGARGYLLKSDAGDAVVDAVTHLIQHKPYFTAKVSEILLTSFLHPESADTTGTCGSSVLTSREREIVQLVAEGKSGKEVAATLGISEGTVETHRTNLMRKLGIHSVSEIVRFAIRNRMIVP